MLMIVYECAGCGTAFAVQDGRNVTCPNYHCEDAERMVVELGREDVHVPTQHEESIGG